MIPVTKTFFPELSAYSKYLQEIWSSGIIANRGKFVLKLEDELKKYLKVNNIIITNNGTVPLQIAIKALNLQGEIITTPFSYIATTSVILWQKCTPKFVDIDPFYLTIDENLVEEAITTQTSAIIATHVFGNPCNLEMLSDIAKKHGLPIIYDAAHCFGVKFKGSSIFNWGDVSTCSFHATKLFHTGEGGAMFSSNEKLFQELKYSHNFGHKGQLEYHGVGINGKMSELQAALGLAILPYLDFILLERKKICDRYDELLDGLPVRQIKIREHVDWNYSYYPVILENETVLEQLLENFNALDIYPRRYFYPSLSTLGFLDQSNPTPISDQVAKKIICLPLYVGLSEDDQMRIVRTIRDYLGRKMI